MRITNWNRAPLAQVRYLNASSAGKPEVVRLDVTLARAARMPPGLRGLILTADLQGREDLRNRFHQGEPPLLGEVLAHELEVLGGSLLLPPAHDVGVILAGDLWADPHSRKRGGLGDVEPVWDAFARSFRWVAGVLGNHDTLDTRSYGHQHLFDGTWERLNGLCIGGVSGIIGHKGKPNRKTADEFVLQLYEVLDQKPDVVILHMGPDNPASGLVGSDEVRAALEAYPPTLVVCGHCHADEPIHRLANGTQVVNVDARTIVVVPEEAQAGVWE